MNYNQKKSLLSAKCNEADVIPRSLLRGEFIEFLIMASYSKFDFAPKSIFKNDIKLN
jgi:hypothetical protein